MSQDAVKRGMVKNKDFKTLKAMKIAVKFIMRHKSSILSVVHCIEDPNEYAFSGFLFVDVVRTELFLNEINDLEILATDIGISYLHGYTKKNHAIAGSEFVE